MKDISISSTDWDFKSDGNFQETVNAWKTSASRQGFIFPLSSDEAYYYPATHELIYHGRRNLGYKEAQEGIAGFLIYALGCLYGGRLQFHDWWVTGKSKTKLTPMFHVRPDTVSHALDTLSRWYWSNKAETRRVATSALFLHNQVHSYPVIWEQFMWQYTVFDSCWRIFEIGNRTRRTSHKSRFAVVAKHYGVRRDQRQFYRWARLRNDLVHQATWGKKVPGYRSKGQPYNALFPLRSFTTHVLLASIGLDFKGIRMPWDTRSLIALDPL